MAAGPEAEQGWTLIQRRLSDDLLLEVKGSAYWAQGIGYRVNREINGVTRAIDIEFVDDDWYILDSTPQGYRTNGQGKVPRLQLGLGYWPIGHPRHPDYQTIEQTLPPAMSQEPMAQTSAGPESQIKSPKDQSEEGGFKGSKPDVFDGDRKKSNAFITDLEIYFRINRNKKDVQNYYS